MALYDSPCDEPGYYAREYSEESQRDNEKEDDCRLEEFLCKDLEDQFDELLEVNWESPR